MIGEVSFAKLTVGLVFFSLAVRAENKTGISVIPRPNKIEVKSGEFSLTRNTRIILPDDNEDLQAIVDQLDSDKKRLGGKVRWVLPRTIGDVFLTDDLPSSIILEVIKEMSGNTGAV